MYILNLRNSSVVYENNVTVFGFDINSLYHGEKKKKKKTFKVTVI